MFSNNNTVAMTNLALSDAGKVFFSLITVEVKNEKNEIRSSTVVLKPTSIRIVVLGKALTKLFLRISFALLFIFLEAEIVN